MRRPHPARPPASRILCRVARVKGIQLRGNSESCTNTQRGRLSCWEILQQWGGSTDTSKDRITQEKERGREGSKQGWRNLAKNSAQIELERGWKVPLYHRMDCCWIDQAVNQRQVLDLSKRSWTKKALTLQFLDWQNGCLSSQLGGLIGTWPSHGIWREQATTLCSVFLHRHGYSGPKYSARGLSYLSPWFLWGGGMSNLSYL